MKSLISLQNITHAYWKTDIDDSAERSADDLQITFEDFSLELPPGMLAILGENGVGKSTLLLLAAARLFPARGKITINGLDSLEFIDAHKDPARAETRNRLVSVVFQNMEFETEEKLGSLLETVRADSGRAGKQSIKMDELIKAFALADVLSRRMQELSKGEQQRAIMALAVAYGSQILVMDEPVFALEEKHKRQAFEYLREYCRSSGTSLYFTAHDIELCRDFSEHMLLLKPDQSYLIGPSQDICTRENLESVYKSPMATLYQKEQLYRQMLLNKAGLS